MESEKSVGTVTETEKDFHDVKAVIIQKLNRSPRHIFFKKYLIDGDELETKYFYLQNIFHIQTVL